MGAGASADIRNRLLAGEGLSGVAFNTEFLFEDIEFDPRVGNPALLGDRFTGADISQVEWLRPGNFGSGELFSNRITADASFRFDPNDCLGSVYGYNRDLVVAVQLLCARRPDFLEASFECYNSRVGCAAVWLYHNGKMQLVVIDDRIPCLPVPLVENGIDGPIGQYDYKPLSASLRNGEAWLPLLEKAMAKLHGSYTASALGDGLRDIIRDLTGESVIDVSLSRLDAQARRELFFALYPRFVSGALGLAARKSATSSFTCNDTQRLSCVADLIKTDSCDGMPANTTDHLGNAIQAKAGIPDDELTAIRFRAEQGRLRGDDKDEDDGCCYVSLIVDESVPFSTIEARVSDSVDEDERERSTNETKGGDRVKYGHAASSSSGLPLEHSQPFRPPHLSKLPKWLSWAQFCSDYSLLAVAVLPATGHVCGRNARIDNPFLKTSTSTPSVSSSSSPSSSSVAGAVETSDPGDHDQDPDEDTSRNAYNKKLQGLGATLASSWDHSRGTAGGGAHLPTFRDNPVFRCRIKRPHPRRGRLVVTLSLLDGRREGEIVCRGGSNLGDGVGGGGGDGGGGGGSANKVSFADASAGIDLGDWDGDQETGGAMLYPPAALQIAHDEPSLQYTLVATDYHSQRDHTIEMDVNLSDRDYNNRGGRPVTSFGIIPYLLDYGSELPFFLSAAFIDEESGLRCCVELTPLTSFPSWEFTRTLRAKWVVGHTAAGRVSASSPYAFLNPAWKMQLHPEGEYDGNMQALDASEENKVESSNLFSSTITATAPAHDDSGDKMGVSHPPPRISRKRDLNVHRLQVLLVLRVFPPEPFFFLGDTDDLMPPPKLEIESLAAKGTTGGRGNIPPPGNPRGSGGSRGLRSAVGNSSRHSASRGQALRQGNSHSLKSAAGLNDGSDDPLVVLGLAAPPPVSRVYPYDPHQYKSAVYIMTPAAYGMLVHHPGSCGDAGQDDGFIGKQLFSTGAFSHRCEYLSAIGRSSPMVSSHDGRSNLLSTVTDPAAASRERIAAYRYSKSHVGYSIGTDVYDELVLMPALWEALSDGQFELEVYCNLPFTLTRIDHTEVSAPVLTTRQKSIAAREKKHKEADEREKQRRIREHRAQSNSSRLKTMERGEFTLREDYLAPRSRAEKLAMAENFYGSGMLTAEVPPEGLERALLRDTIRATMPHKGLAFCDDKLCDDDTLQSSKGETDEPGKLSASVSDLGTASVTSHIQNIRASIAVRIRDDTSARLFGLRMKTIENATRQDSFSGVGDSSPIPALKNRKK